jgi:hypothetical protein
MSKLRVRVPALALVALLVGSMAAVTSGAAFAEEYLYDVLAKPGYRKSWNTLFIGEQHVASWLTRYARTKNGPTTPGTTIALGDARYQVHHVCKVHDCGDNMFHVLFALDGARAWGLLLQKGRDERFFGNPDEEKKEALRTAARD